MATKVLPEAGTSKYVMEPWNVILLNDDYHGFDEVIIQLIKATGCTQDQAAKIAWDVHNLGEAVCYSGPKERCEHVAAILEEIKLKVRLDR